MNIRKLIPGDEVALEAFLSQHTQTSMFLRSNLRMTSLLYKDAPYHGDYIASFDRQGNVDGVLGHFWNGNIIVQSPDLAILLALAEYFCALADRPVKGLIGDSPQVHKLADILGLTESSYSHNLDENLYSLDLSGLIIPDNLAKPDWRVRSIAESDRALLIDWLAAYGAETLGEADTAESRQKNDIELSNSIETGRKWILEVSGKPVALSGFNAVLPDSVQIGPVWTPPELRSRGYARALLAGSLKLACDCGVLRAILFANEPAAIKAYEAIGFTKIGHYRLAFLKQPLNLRAGDLNE